jgi:hypothetical protein
MGMDVSLTFVPRRLDVGLLATVAGEAFAPDPPGNLVLLYTHTGPAYVQQVFPELTAVALWADREDSPEPFALEISRVVGKAVAWTKADHASVGGWQMYENGAPGPGHSTPGAAYAEQGICGLEAAFGVRLNVHGMERGWCTEGFLLERSGICVFGTGPLQASQVLTLDQIQAIEEYDFRGVELECMLLV